MKKYGLLLNDTIQHEGRTLYRIIALKSFSRKRLPFLEIILPFFRVRKGSLGGYIESESNLSQNGDCWVYENAKIWGSVELFGNVQIGE